MIPVDSNIPAASTAPITVQPHREGTFTVEPLGWVIQGVLCPLESPKFVSFWPVGLLCCERGIIEFRRTLEGFISAGITAGFGSQPTFDGDQLDVAFPQRVRPIPNRTYLLSDLEEIRFRWRIGKNQVHVVLRGKEPLRYGVLARAASTDYLAMLKRLYGPIVTESGITGRTWWSRLLRK